MIERARNDVARIANKRGTLAPNNPPRVSTMRPVDAFAPCLISDIRVRLISDQN